MSQQITHLKLLSHLSGANELMHWGLNKMASLQFADISKCILLKGKFIIFYWNFTEACSWGSYWQVSIDPGYGLVLNRQQALTWKMLT